MIGAIVGFVGRNSGLGPRLVLFLQTGICGGFTTFSTFSLETVSLLEEGKFVVAVLYIVLSVVFGFLALLMAKVLCKYMGLRIEYACYSLNVIKHQQEGEMRLWIWKQNSLL